MKRGITEITPDHFGDSDENASSSSLTDAGTVRQDTVPALKAAKKEPPMTLKTFWAFRITGSKISEDGGNPTEEDDERLFQLFDTTEWIEEFGYQLEVGGGKGKIQHYQGTLKVHPRKKWDFMHAWFKSNFPKLEFPAKDYCEPTKSSAHNSYGVKSKTRLRGPWVKGETFKQEASKTTYVIDIDLRPWQKKACAILEQIANDRDIYWLWEPKGGLGKTTFQKWLFLYYDLVLPLSGKTADIKNAIVQYKEDNDGKVPRIILVNIPKTKGLDYFSYEGAEVVKDMFFYSGKYKGGVVCDRCPHMLIFANEPPDTTSMSPDRWKIIRLPDGKGSRDEILYENWEE